MIRVLLFIPIVMVCLAAAPATSPVAPVARTEIVGQGSVPSVEKFEYLLQHDPVAALDASLARFHRDVHGYQCIFQKQERLRGKLGEVEVIRHAVREEPFATTLVWEQGGGAAKAAAYIRGENAGRMKVKSKYLITTNTDPNGIIARGSSRYSMEDAGIFNGTLRTLRGWKDARDKYELQVEYLGKQKVPELGGRECYVLHRRIPGGEVDNFRMADRDRRPAKDHTDEAFTDIMLYFDCETWLQTGSVLKRDDGTLIGAYWFKDVLINPTFAPTQFTPAILQQ